MREVEDHIGCDSLDEFGRVGKDDGPIFEFLYISWDILTIGKITWELTVDKGKFFDTWDHTRDFFFLKIFKGAFDLWSEKLSVLQAFLNLSKIILLDNSI